MGKKNLVIAGGGSTYTLGLLKTLAEEKTRFPLRRITLYDIDAERQKKVFDAGKVLLEEDYDWLHAFNQTTDIDTAFKDADIVFVQIRVGGLEMRRLDEAIPMRFGLVGQETVGAGGIAYGMRSIGAMSELISAIRTQAPEAWVINYTNPAAVVGLALKRLYPDDKRILDICDMPAIILKYLADTVGEDMFTLRPDYFGLNHFGWFAAIRDKNGKDLTTEIKKAMTEKKKPLFENVEEDDSWRKTFEMAFTIFHDFPDYFPNTYLQYHLYPLVIARRQDPDHTRADAVMAGREKKTAELQESITAEKKARDKELTPTMHATFLIRVATALFSEEGARFIVLVPNRGYIDSLPGEALVEVPAVLDSHGVHPMRQTGISRFQSALLQNQHARDMLVVEAYLEKSYQRLLEAMTLDRTVVDARKARDVLDALIEANEDYWPPLS